MAGDAVPKCSSRCHKFFGMLLVGSLLPGCAGTWDFLTSERFKSRPVGSLFDSNGDPLTILETTNDGHQRALALRDLREPKRKGKPEAEQEKALAYLRTSAVNDSRAMCRLEAIEALGRFEDPRAVPILIDAYKNAGYEGSSDPNVKPAGGVLAPNAASTFTPDTVTDIQVRAIRALGKHRKPEALPFLCEIASMRIESLPGEKSLINQTDYRLELTPSEGDRHRLKAEAIRALGGYEKNRQAIQTLIDALANDRDVAIRGLAHTTLLKITDQDFPPEAKPWQDWLAKMPVAPEKKK